MALNLHHKQGKLEEIYDANNAYIYSTGSLTQISEFPYTVNNRSELSLETDLSNYEIEMVRLSDNVLIGYGVSPRTPPVNAVCNVTRVSQSTNNLCWAATTATIYNYINNLSGSNALDDVDVASTYLSGNYDRMIDIDQIDDVLAKFNIDYEGKDSYDLLDPLNDGDIYTSLYNGYPAFGCFQIVGGLKHAGTIYACNVIAGRMSIMDPSCGSQVATPDSNGVYTYVSTGNGATLQLEKAFFSP